MNLSNDLISQFVKVTRDDNIKKKETTVYGTTVQTNNKMYVKIDGSDLLTPIITTSELKVGERVTILIKDHQAIVTGNITTPAASTDTTDGIKEDLTTLESNSIKDTKVQYYLSDSSTELIGGSWIDDMVTWTEGKYIWQRTIYTYNDGTVKVDGEVCIQGAKGEDAYRVEITSSNGNIFKNNNIYTILYARVYRGETEVTNNIAISRFRWTRVSTDSYSDNIWNQNHFAGATSVIITTEDVRQRATFNCQLLDENLN